LLAVAVPVIVLDRVPVADLVGVTLRVPEREGVVVGSAVDVPVPVEVVDGVGVTTAD
jgi:hypothetical protein